ncbi:MAG: hypothetical protein ACRD1Y_10565, partial [Terriglobales bacterium]
TCGLRALLLAGSLARYEGSWLPHPRRTVLLGDAEWICLVPDASALPPAAMLRFWERLAAIRLRAQGIEAQVTLTAAHERYLRRLPAHIFGYELLQCGRVVRGDGDVLRQAPAMAPAAIPPADAWRLLTNRLVELLPHVFNEAPRKAEPQAAYPWVKLVLDLATSYLVFTGGYAPTYQARCRKLMERGPARGDGILTPEFLGQVEAATAWKLAPKPAAAEIFLSPDFRDAALARAEALWNWELRWLTHSPAGTSRRELWQRWLGQQPLSTRLRGWASAVRHGGAGPGAWPRWLQLAQRASPRHCVYEAAIALAFAPREAAAVCRHCLPLPPRSDLSASVLDNYYRLVASTRA